MIYLKDAASLLKLNMRRKTPKNVQLFRLVNHANLYNYSQKGKEISGLEKSIIWLIMKYEVWGDGRGFFESE